MSSYYGIVFPEFWTGDTGRAIQERGGKDAQLLALYLMSNRYATMIGLYPLMVRDVRYETGIALKGLVRGFGVLGALDFADYDAATEHVWVREMAKFRLNLLSKSPLAPGDNKVKGVQNLYERLTANPFLEPFFDRYAKELRLRKRRACGLVATPLLDVALTRGFQGACKPVTGSGIRDQGSEKKDQDLPPHKPRWPAHPVEISEPDHAEAGGMATTLRDCASGASGGSVDGRGGVEGAGEGPDRGAQSGATQPARHDQSGVGCRGTCTGEGGLQGDPSTDAENSTTDPTGGPSVAGTPAARERVDDAIGAPGGPSEETPALRQLRAVVRRLA